MAPKKTAFKFSFYSPVSTKNMLKLRSIISQCSNYFEMAQNAKMQTEDENNTQRGRSKRRNCQRKCFHLFNYEIDHKSIYFNFYVNSIHCFL